jgi:ATP-dependent DNA ligase
MTYDSNRQRVVLFAGRAPLAFGKPQLAALVKKVPDGPDWLHKIKLDGYRTHARLDGRPGRRAEVSPV